MSCQLIRSSGLGKPRNRYCFAELGLDLLREILLKKKLDSEATDILEYGLGVLVNSGWQ